MDWCESLLKLLVPQLCPCNPYLSQLDGLIEGKYNEKVKRYHILDCRFDYEFEGGHIAGAINVKSMDCLDELLLSASQGVHSNGNALPAPIRSG